MKKKNEMRQRARVRLLNQRKAAMAAAKNCYDFAYFYKEAGCIPGVVYWEDEYRRLTAKAQEVI